MNKYIATYLKNISLLTLFIIVFIGIYFSSYNLFDDWFIITMIIVFSIIWIYITIEAYKQAKQYDVELSKGPLIIKEMYKPILLQHQYTIPVDTQMINNHTGLNTVTLLDYQSKQELFKLIDNLIITETEIQHNGSIKVLNKIYIYKKD